VPYFSKITYHFAIYILTPPSCGVGKWSKKQISYNDYHELAYLHPKYFKPDEKTIKTFNPESKRYFILHFAKLDVYHDYGKTSVTKKIVRWKCPYRTSGKST